MFDTCIVDCPIDAIWLNLCEFVCFAMTEKYPPIPEFVACASLASFWLTNATRKLSVVVKTGNLLARYFGVSERELNRESS